jgi:protein-tyrosine phosphatase
MDDGSRSVEMSLQMLKEEVSQGIRGIVFTPHFYADGDDPIRFIERRNNAVEHLKPVIGSVKKCPPILLGSEVHFYQGMSRSEDLNKLTVGNTRYLLVEMPFRTWHGSFIKEVKDIGHNLQLQVVIAHIERYLDQDKKLVKELIYNSDVLIQSNAESFIERRTRRKVLKLLKEGSIHFLGSDCHNMSDRMPNLKEAEQIILKARLEDMLDKTERRCIDLFRMAGANI